MRSFTASALLTTILLGQSNAAATSEPDRELTPSDKSAFLKFVKGFLRSKHLQARQEPVSTDRECILDEYDTFLAGYSSATAFCSNFISIPLETATAYYTPTVYV